VSSIIAKVLLLLRLLSKYARMYYSAKQFVYVAKHTSLFRLRFCSVECITAANNLFQLPNILANLDYDCEYNHTLFITWSTGERSVFA